MKVIIIKIIMHIYTYTTWLQTTLPKKDHKVLISIRVLLEVYSRGKKRIIKRYVALRKEKSKENN